MSKQPRRGFFRAIVLFTLAFGPPSAVATSGTPTWTFSLVGSPGANTYVSTPDLAFDHYGTPSVSWSLVSTVGAANSVRHSQLLGLGIWDNRELLSASGAGIRTAHAFDRAERPSVAWINDNGSVQGQFNYAGNQTITASGANVLAPTLSLYYDLAGSLRGTYGTSSAGAYWSIGFTAPNFNTASMTTVPGVSTVQDAKMVVDHRGLRQLAARATLSGGGQALSLASEPPGGGGAWPSTNFVTADAVDGVDVEVDPTDGRVAVAYTTFTSATNTSRLFYTKFDGGSTTTTQILSTTSERYYDLSLDFDRSDGRPAIAYERKVNATSAQELWFAFLNPSSVWQAGLVDATISSELFNGMPRGPSMAFDDYGTSWPAIAYTDADGSLRVAFDPPVPEPATALLLGLAFIPRRRLARRAGVRR
jgi:hypothetical protein